jgi:hypothetical protein
VTVKKRSLFNVHLSFSVAPSARHLEKKIAPKAQPKMKDER